MSSASVFALVLDRTERAIQRRQKAVATIAFTLGIPESSAQENLRILESRAGFEIDRFFERPNWPKLAKAFERAQLTAEQQRWRDNYPDGVELKLDRNTIWGAIKDERLRGWLKSYRGQRGALILGPSGLGKTMVAIAALTRVQSNFFATAESLARESLSHPFGKGEPEMFAKASRRALVAIDDFGWERTSQSQPLRDVLAKRYSRGLHTIVTSNLRLSEFDPRYGARVRRRILESGGVQGQVIDLWQESSNLDE